jgi:hypothetical protein
MSITKSGLYNVGINSLSLRNHKPSVAQTNSTVVKNQLRNNNIKIQDTTKLVNLNNNINKHITNSSNSYCVNNLNLIACHVDKLSSEKIQPLYNNNKLVVRNTIQSVTHDKNDDDQNDNKGSCKENNQFFEKYYTKVLSKIYEYLISNGYSETFKIIVIYKEINDTTLIEKQLITAIPFIDNQPQRSISEIAIITKTGEINKCSMPVFLHIGGYSYTRDWLSISSAAIGQCNILQKISIEYGEFRIKGFCVNYDSTEECDLVIAANMKLYIPGFSKIWT